MIEVAEKWIDYKDAEGYQLSGFLVHPKGADSDGKRVPCVLVMHAFAGITEFEEEKCRELAQLGYIAFATDVYGKGVRGTTREENFALLKPLRSDRRGILKSRLMAGLQLVKGLSFVDQNKIAAFGYCFGGLNVIDMARYSAGLAAVVSFHGSFDPLPALSSVPTEESGDITTKLMICHGDADSHVSLESAVALMAELRARNADFQFISYAHAKHAFTEPKFSNSDVPGVGYNEAAARRSWSQATAFLTEILCKLC